MENTLDKIDSIGVLIRVDDRPLTKKKLSYHFAEGEPRTRLATAGAASSGALALCGFIALLCTLVLAQPIPIGLWATNNQQIANASLLQDPPEVKPGYWMQCPDPVCLNDRPMAPIHWHYVNDNTNWIDIEYACTNCGTLFFVRKRTH